ncbi:hypothetical protein [Actinophytocola glycyrrhizae]|uniref:Uncharacterized protein n=1 Tax=Actinophytocola glycyrrhizae TaxID=2044873 RepID=A0ABV9RX21_9PSEU
MTDSAETPLSPDPPHAPGTPRPEAPDVPEPDPRQEDPRAQDAEEETGAVEPPD